MWGRRYGKFGVGLAVVAGLVLVNEVLEFHIEEKESSEVAAEVAELTDMPVVSVEPTDVPGASADSTDVPGGSTEPTDMSGGSAEPMDMPAVSAVPTAADGADVSVAEVGSVYEEPRIRVLLMDTDYNTYYHPSVTVVQEGQERTYTTESVQAEGGSVILEGGEDGIMVTSVERQEGNPVYPGTLEIRETAEGILLINELPLETYLESVVPSEMPASYGQEALRAQAICARTYACRQMADGKLMETFGADVDDSVNYQVYRNISPKEATSRAVHATEGQVLTQNGELIEAYYFSTSAGVTSTDEIWGAEKSASYLKSVPCDFDSDEPWRKWSVSIPWKTLETRAGTLTGCSGKLLSLTAFAKSQSGAVTELEIITEGGTAQISGEYDIRQFLSPQSLSITENNGKTTTGGPFLPSAYFTMNVNTGESIDIQGGGYGHGVGMSQTAANTMSSEGYTCQEILEYFFKDVTLTDLSELS